MMYFYILCIISFVFSVKGWYTTIIESGSTIVKTLPRSSKTSTVSSTPTYISKSVISTISSSTNVTSILTTSFSSTSISPTTTTSSTITSSPTYTFTSCQRFTVEDKTEYFATTNIDKADINTCFEFCNSQSNVPKTNWYFKNVIQCTYGISGVPVGCPSPSEITNVNCVCNYNYISNTPSSNCNNGYGFQYTNEGTAFSSEANYEVII